MKPTPPPFQDDLLGTMPWEEEEGGWVSRSSSRAFRIVVAGTQRPDARLLQSAHALYADSAKISAQVAALLEDFAGRVPEAAIEVSGLQIGAIHLMWPERPGDGMIYFDGSDPDRLWHCDYVAGVPRDLVFDD